MIRILLIQQLFNLSDEQMEFQSSSARKTSMRAGARSMAGPASATRSRPTSTSITSWCAESR
ncbi:hypothetical protein [Janthinobacterium rivuli]|uniref:hypothetical protein n=1 Tax=Janthinobacterium rivuli TaxID=2751478 RepID=UPI00383B8413